MLKSLRRNERTIARSARSTPLASFVVALVAASGVSFLAGSALLFAGSAVADDTSTRVDVVQEAAAIDPNAMDPSEVAAAPDSADSPLPTIETFHAGLLQIMKEAETIGFQGRIDRLAPLMAEVFDLDFMASKTVGGHWRKLSDPDKERWMKLFSQITIANYAGRFTGYTGEKFVTTSVEEAKRGQQLVLTKIVLPEDEDVQLNYRLRKTSAGWKVIDVYLNGTVSELALRRSEYSTALKREGFEELIASIQTKIEDLKAKGLVDG